MQRLIALLLMVCAVAAPAPAGAQLGGVTLPQVPNVGEVLDSTTETLDRPLRDVRRLRVRELLRVHRRELEADPSGQPIVRGQILALGISDAALARAQGEGYEIVRTDGIDDATNMVTLRAPRGLSTRRALRRLREADSEGVYDFDHLHLESGASLTVAPFAQSGAAPIGPRIGLIDSGVSETIAGIVARRSFASESPVVAAHGTAIAALLSSAAPSAHIYSADIYAGVPTGGASSALGRALAWLANENVPVINVSLVGPRNRIVETLVARMIARGFIIVAAVGNDGPAAAPLFPAAYDGVVGVTGVDARDRVLVEAGRGAHVDFAALGVHGRVRGTSYAAPLVAARLAQQASNLSPQRASRALADLRGQARDLGANGRDDTYGYGLIAAR